MLGAVVDEIGDQVVGLLDIAMTGQVLEDTLERVAPEDAAGAEQTLSGFEGVRQKLQIRIVEVETAKIIASSNHLQYSEMNDAVARRIRAID